MPELSDVYAYFWVEGSASPAEITSLMGVEPTEFRAVGDRFSSGRIAHKNWWQLQSPLARGDHLLQDYLEALLPVLEAKASVVKHLAKNSSAGVNCVGYYYASNPGLHLSAALIARLAGLDLSVDFDLYNYAAEDAL